MAKKQLILVDGSWLMYRAFFAIPPHFTNADGLHTNAIFGFASMFRKVVAQKKTEAGHVYGAVVFDSKAETFRAKEFPQYKAQRPSMPHELREQIPYIDRVVETHGFTLLRVDGYEADDVIGTLCKEARSKDFEVLLVAGDKDLAQLIDPHVRMQDTLRDVVFDEELVKKKWGVYPTQIPDYLALVGDDVDNIPGLPGVGAKTASQLIDQYKDVEGILANVDALKGKVKLTVSENQENLRLYRKLTQLDLDAKLEIGVLDLEVKHADPKTVGDLYRELAFNSLLSNDERESKTDIDFRDSNNILLELQQHENLELASYIWLEDADHPTRSRVLALALAIPSKDGKANDLVLQREPTPEQSKAFVEALFARKTRFFVHDRKSIAVAGNIVEGRKDFAAHDASFDLMLASFLIDPTKLIPHRLEQIAKEYLQKALPLAKTAGDVFSRENLCAVAANVDAILQLGAILPGKLEESGLATNLAELEDPLSWTLAKMEERGIRVDSKALAQLETLFTEERIQVEQAIYQKAGREFNIGSTKQLATILFEDLKLPVIKKTKTGYSTDAEVLERLAPKHDIARDLLRQRELSKLINTYTSVLREAVDPRTERIHARLQQTSGASGRLISTDPDLQRTPVRTKEGKEIRRCFIASSGTKLISADWSQIELRVLAHFSNDQMLIDAFSNKIDLHRATAAKLFQKEAGEVSPEERNIGKTINFATIYGQGATSLGQILGIPRTTAEAYIRAYFELYSGVRTWLDNTIQDALRDGYVTTLLGRKRVIPELASRSPMDQKAGERIAANTPIQGSAADLCKLAMLKIDRDLRAKTKNSHMLLQIHDELVFEVAEDEVDVAKSIIEEHMKNPYPLRVPLEVNIGVANTWAEAHF